MKTVLAASCYLLWSLLSILRKDLAAELRYLDTAVGGGADRLTGVGAVLQHPEHNHVWLVYIEGPFPVDVHLPLIQVLGNSKSHDKLQDYTVGTIHYNYKISIKKTESTVYSRINNYYLKIWFFSVPKWV